MYDPRPDDKDGFIRQFEAALTSRKKNNDVDEEIRQKIREQIEELPNTVSGDK